MSNLQKQIIYIPKNKKTGQSRSSHQRCSVKKGALRNFTGKHLCQSLFFNKVAGLRPATLLKKETLVAQVFSCEFVKFLRTPFLQNTSGRLLLTGPIFSNICLIFHFRISVYRYVFKYGKNYLQFKYIKFFDNLWPPSDSLLMRQNEREKNTGETIMIPNFDNEVFSKKLSSFTDMI